MQYVRSISGSVSKTWNSINPATLSGAIDVIVVEQEDGSLACSPFHVRFGKFSLLRPSEKKVEFRVNDVKRDFPMKLGEGGEAFFVFETSASIPEALQTSPLVSPASSPPVLPAGDETPGLERPDPFDLSGALDGAKLEGRRHDRSMSAIPSLTLDKRSQSDASLSSLNGINIDTNLRRPSSRGQDGHMSRSVTDDVLPSAKEAMKRTFQDGPKSPQRPSRYNIAHSAISERSTSPPPISSQEAMTRAVNLSKKLWTSNIPSHVTETGDLMLDMTGYKSGEEDAIKTELIARQILSEEVEGHYDIGALIGADERGNIWIYSSEEAKEAASRKTTLGLSSAGMVSTDAISDPGYHSDDNRSEGSADYSGTHLRRDSDSAVGLSSPPESPQHASAGDPNRNYAKTLRLTSDQLKSLDLKYGQNPISFTVNRATCTASMYLWRCDVPVVVSDIDGTITKSDALGHVLNMIGRDWTHLGVAKLYTEISNNGYNIFYLTSRSVGQADSTRAYLNGVNQEGHRLPKGPVIMSPDRTMAALRREVYLRKPEVFKMACLRDILNLYNKKETPFYAGFGNRFTDALSYRSVSIPPTRIFTINSSAEVTMDVLSLNKYKTGYASMREIVDHFFPPVGLLIKSGGEEYTDFNYWRERPLDLDEFSDSESEEDTDDKAASLSRVVSRRSEDEGTEGEEEDEEGNDELGESFISQSVDDADATGIEDSIIESVEGDLTSSMIQEDEAGDVEEDEVLDMANGQVADQLDALDLSSTAPLSEQGADAMKEDLRELSKVLNSPEKPRVESPVAQRADGVLKRDRAASATKV